MAFVAAVEAGSFTAAGRKLGVSGSAVGKSVDRLEGRLGVVLLQRTTRSIALTGEGEVLFARAVKILDSVRDAEEVIGSAKAIPSGRLKVSLPVVMGRHLIVPGLPRFMNAYPEVELDLWLDDRIVDMVVERFDLAIRLGDLEDSSLHARRIGPHKFITCASPYYLLAFGEPQTPLDLAAHRCIRYRFPSTGRLEHWEFDGSVKTQLGAGLVLNDGDALAAAAVGGLGLVQLPSYQVVEHVAAGRLRPVLNTYQKARGDIWLVWPPGRSEVLRTRVFAEFLKDLLGDCR